ncbi:MAG: hypothetical protein A2563_02070 [Candidatus Magasanikbacteria bacterium RIFOXYD1_FULL_40_23]|uniref:Uncharacterized protein n=1 Tax=Candidatus Magasanikbacteria bacterium RIFOXYD1_FULL_40_23 TaxID=1798705 RepID=A0A1F6PBP3_9BACT|nr:MAG: hypothetical protein A2563_02070 [Candidatus Magasanikbacteria bacterium RIFOXYD1_FULL_40_23]
MFVKKVSHMQWKKNGLLTLASICLIGMMAQEVAAQSNEDPPADVVVETSVVPVDDDCAEGKPRTEIQVDAVTGVIHTVKNIDTACVEVINHTYNGKDEEAPAVSPAVTLDPFPVTVVETSRYRFGGGLFGSGFVLLQPRDDRDGYDESVEEMLTAGFVGTLNTRSWEWSANVGVGGCGKSEVAATAGAALLNKRSDHFGLGPTVNLSFCSNVDDPGEELVQLRAVDAGLRLAGNWEHFGMFADVVGAVSTEPMYVGRWTGFGLGVRLGIRTGWF